LYRNFQESHTLSVFKLSQTTYNILETKGKKTTRNNPILAFPSCLVTPLLVSQHLLNNNQMQQMQKNAKKTRWPEPSHE
jgi:hypothetical protein